MTLPRTLALVAVVCLVVPGCSRAEGRSLPGCTGDQLATHTHGRLTLSTGVVTRPPWVSGPAAPGQSTDPRNGQGYDAATGYALAQRLGFDRGHVTWVATSFADALAPGAKPWDVNVNQITIRADRSHNVDFSRPYYVMRQAVVTLQDRPAARARTLDDLRSVTFAVVKGSAAEAALRALHRSPVVVTYPDLDQVRGAVSSGAQQAMVTDYATALRLDRDETQLVNGTLVGVLPGAADPTAEQFGMVLQKGSPLTRCVDEALDAMERDGTLEQLQRRWLVTQQRWTWFD